MDRTGEQWKDTKQDEEQELEGLRASSSAATKAECCKVSMLTCVPVNLHTDRRGQVVRFWSSQHALKEKRPSPFQGLQDLHPLTHII